MQAIKIIDGPAGQTAEIQDVPRPTLRDGYILCKVKYVALNPTDCMSIMMAGFQDQQLEVTFRTGGVVEEIGPKVSKNWKKGDRIATFVHGGNDTHPNDGTFADYCLAKGDLGMKVPNNMSDENAAGFGIPSITCGQGLYQSLGLPLPGTAKYGGFLLVYGGSTSVGIFAIQFAILSGCRVVATASERNWPLIKSLGAEELFDYKDPQCAEKIRQYTNNELSLALDCVSEGDSAKICEQAISSKGGTITFLLSSAKDMVSRKDVERKHTSGYTIFGESFDKLGSHVPAKPDHFEHAKMFWRLTEKLAHEGRLKPHPLRIGKDGLEGVLDGLQQGREGKIRAEKLVHRIDLTA